MFIFLAHSLRIKLIECAAVVSPLPQPSLQPLTQLSDFKWKIAVSTKFPHLVSPQKMFSPQIWLSFYVGPFWKWDFLDLISVQIFSYV